MSLLSLLHLMGRSRRLIPLVRLDRLRRLIQPGRWLPWVHSARPKGRWLPWVPPDPSLPKLRKVRSLRWRRQRLTVQWVQWLRLIPHRRDPSLLLYQTVRSGR